ncbi:hypothetical protein BT63DRAFT_432951 [Microthyrium microscopicum]|uniref:Zn(2)-C6 fungal-type domain-containing protein n=1 Tax=Microthyrium microscopicum TaxID=703497 RepID=A0A6A6UAP2_9PEZI|nr:hypothetical protein BT63DRAFT_432951 [Microthyrium microscopicum]
MAADDASTKAAQQNAANSEVDTDSKEQNEHESQATTNGKKTKARHRASVACATCRDRRIRCVVPQGESECTQCKRSGVECVIKNDDERRRPISRAYMCSLTDRITVLESMLKDTGQDLPPAQHPPMTRHGARSEESDPSTYRKDSKTRQVATKASGGSHSENQHSSPDSQGDELMFDRENSPSHQGDDSHSAHSAPSPSMIPPPKKDGIVSRLLSTRGHLSFDQLNGRLRYFGPTTNCHVHSEFGMPAAESREAMEQSRRADKAIRQLSVETYDYLMGLFWQHYNTYLHVLHYDAFQEDKERGGGQFFSPFLHICVLAMGYRFADRSRPDMQRITVGPRESSLHREAKYMLDFELERPGSIPSVAALLLLGDMECSVGRDNVGWLYAGMANRIAFDIGLHLDARSTGLCQRELDIRRMTLWACVVYDKYWALFLGRPTSMKSADLEVYHLAKQFERLGTCKPAGEEKALETQIYEALLDLMELAGGITENMEGRSMSDSAAIDQEAYLRMASLDREFGRWHSRLPEQLKYNNKNVETAPLSFFLLHQQYHTCLILLHRPFAMYEEAPATDEENANSTEHHFSALSRAVCTKQALKVAKIFWHHRQRFNGRQIPVTGMQHAGTAATALVAALAFLKDGNDRNNNMQYLECLSAALHDMSYTYQPAERMFIVLQAVLAELRGLPASDNLLHKIHAPSHHNHIPHAIPARRDSSSMDAELPSFSNKRRQLNRGMRHSFNDAVRPAHLDLQIDPLLASVGRGRKASDAGGELERPDSYVLVTPRSELGSWPAGGTGSILESSASAGGATWMGADAADSHDISALASVHFPELRDLPTIGENGEPATVPNLDFLSFGNPGDEWREWGATGSNGVEAGGELDGFGNNGAFASGFPTTPGRFESRLAGLSDAM